MNWRKNLDVCLGIDRVMIMMLNMELQILHEGRAAVSRSLRYAKSLALCLAHRRSSIFVEWLLPGTLLFSPLPTEVSTWELQMQHSHLNTVSHSDKAGKASRAPLFISS